jgi:hypothetical protein
MELDGTISSTIDSFASERQLLSVGTARQGIAIDATWSVRLRAGHRPDELVKALNRLEGIQNVSVTVRLVEEPPA